jgi:hypothetical protein
MTSLGKLPVTTLHVNAFYHHCRTSGPGRSFGLVCISGRFRNLCSYSVASQDKQYEAARIVYHTLETRKRINKGACAFMLLSGFITAQFFSGFTFVNMPKAAA